MEEKESEKGRKTARERDYLDLANFISLELRGTIVMDESNTSCKLKYKK